MPFFHVPLHFGYKKGHFIIKHSGLSLFVFSHSLLLDLMLKSDDHLPPIKKGKRSSLAGAGQSHFKVHSNWHSGLHRNGHKITVVHLTRDVFLGVYYSILSVLYLSKCSETCKQRREMAQCSS